MANHELLKLTANQVNSASYDKAILAVGSCEAHGKHLASGTDTLISYMMACNIAEKSENLLVLPPITVGYSAHYDSFPFTMTLSYDTLIKVVYEYIESTIRNGINRIFVLNGHDGNITAIDIASRQIKEKYPDARIAVLSAWWYTVGDLLPEGTFEVWNGLGHAGEGETSLAYYLYPQWCEPDLAECVMPDNLPSKVDIMWDYSELTHNAMTGDATKGTAEKGEMMYNALSDCAIEAIANLDKCGWNYSTTGAKTQL